MKKLIFQNQSAIESTMSHLNDLKDQVSTLLAEFNKLNLFDLKTCDEVAELINGGDAYIKAGIGNELPAQSLGRFNLKKDQAVQMLDLPDYGHILEMCKRCTDFPFRKNLFVLKSSKLTFNEVELQAYLDTFRTFAVTPEQQRLASAYEDASTALNELQAAFIASGRPGLYHETQIGKYFVVNANGVRPLDSFYQQNFLKQ